MKNLLLTLCFLVLGFFAKAQVYQLDNLDSMQVQHIRSSVLSLSANTGFWQNDSLISIIKDIDKQVLTKKIYSVRLNATAMKKLIGDSMGGLNSNLQYLKSEKERIEAERKRVNTKIGVLKAIRDYEKAKKIADKKSVFEQLNTGFLQNNDFNSLQTN